MKTLVTGGAGFIGSHLVEELLNQGCAVTVLDDFSTGVVGNVPDGAHAIEADVRDGRQLAEILDRERPEIVVHLAAQANVRKSIEDPEGDGEVNILGSLRLFRASARAGVRRIVFASSGGAVYGEYAGEASREIDLPQPSSPYGIAKLAAEHYGRTVAESGGPEFVALRLANVYGPRQNPAGEAGVIAIFLREMLEDRTPVIFGSGEQTRDFVWVGDAVQAFLQAMHGRPGMYNIGTGRRTSISEIYDLLRRITGVEGAPRRLPAVPGEVLHNALSFARANDTFGWSPRMDLRAGLEETVAFELRVSLSARQAPSIRKAGDARRSLE